MTTSESLFKALSDRTRLHALLLLATEGRLCVCELVEALDLSQPLVSRHLGHLRDLGIVRDERRGRWVHYRLHPDLPGWARDILAAAAGCASANEALTRARRRLEAMGERPSLALS